jgi:MFS family permease
MTIKRVAVSAFFFATGFLYANWTARIPELQRQFNISNAMLGGLLFTLAAGALIAMPISGVLTTHWGSKKITQWSGILACCVMPFIPIWQNWMLISLVFVLLGFTMGATDVSMNGQAVYIERLWGKSIMSSFHAVYSIGMALGALTGALASKYQLTLDAHFLIVSLFLIATLFWASSHLLDDKPNKDTEESTEKSTLRSTFSNHFAMPSRAIIPLGLIGFCCMVGEGAMGDWSALYMNKVVGESPYISALAFGTFGTSMTIGRIFGDALIRKMGKRNLLIMDSTLAFIGLGIALIWPTTWITLAGFFLVGLGLATIVPIVYSTAGNMKGMLPSAGIAMATTIAYTGFFVGPPIIGYLADIFGLRFGLCFTLFLFAVMLFIVFRLNLKGEK